MPDTPEPDAIRSALSDAVASLAHRPSPEATIDGIAAALLAAVGARSAVVIVADPDRADLEIVAVAGLDDARSTLEAALADDSHPAAAAVRGGVATWETESAVPLTVNVGGTEQAIGALVLAWEDGVPDVAARAVVETFGDLIAVAIDRSRLGSMASERSEWFERMAHLDPLTGLTNSRTFARVLELELIRAGRQGGEVSLAVFDVDHFREANEEAGHAVGDDILRTVAAVIAESVRLVDTVARYGGDEFIVVAPGAGGIAVARRILESVAALPSVADRTISVSAGLARFPTDGATADDLLIAATRALAEAKDAGQASIVEASSLPAT